MNLRPFSFALALTIAAAAPASGQTVVIDGRVMELSGAVALPTITVAGEAPAEAKSDSDEKPSARQKLLKKLEFDRRPSTILSVWSTPPPSDDEEEEQDEEAAPGDAAESDAEAAAADVVETEETEETEDATETESAEEGDAAEEGEEAEELTPEEIEAAEKAAAKAAEKAEAAKQKAEEAAAKKKQAEAEAKALEKEMTALQRNVTLGEWDAVKTYLAGLTEAEQKAGYTQLLASLRKGPKAPSGIPNQGKAYIEKNRFTLADVLGLAEAAPLDLEEENLTTLGQILKQALDAGHQLPGFLAALEPRLAEEDFALDRRKLARMLLGAGRVLEMEHFLPTTDEAEAEDDREGLNLIARYALAEYAKEHHVAWLQEAWRATQAVLAPGEVEDDVKQEALERAVDIAPKIEEDLGQAWLDESFSARPERGLEILAVIGSAASKGFQSRPTDSAARMKLLQLQTTAAEALLAAAPELADEWETQLDLLAVNWLREALVSYQFDESTSLGPRMQRDVYGNFFYYNYRSYRGNVPTPIATDEILEMRPGEEWLRRVSDTLRPKLTMIFAQLLLKVSEEALAFPYIEEVAATHPDQAKELVDEFLRVWSKNHDPNAARRNTNSYSFFYGFEQRANAIPLTRSKQERNLRELKEWVARLRELPVELDDQLLANAFTKAHSSAEVYRIEAIEEIFGSLEDLKPGTLAELVQTMRSNLASIWRDPALQKAKQTGRRQKDIEAEVKRGYELARATIDRALAVHEDSWELRLALASFEHDENNYRHELGKDSGFSARREQAFESFQLAAELYEASLEGLEREKERTTVYELWFYAALGACDLGAIDSEMVLASRQVPLIQSALAGLPEERAERHVGMFASTLFTRMGNVSPAVKYRYVREGLEITGDHKLVKHARQVFDYYGDLVTEIQLVATIDGTDQVGHDAPFGLRVDIRHTREIERESGGFAKYLQNQNSANFGFNYGRPTEDYRDKFEETVREALAETFDVLSVTFNDPKARSVADPEYGWRLTPYAYVLMKPRGPQVDRIPPLRIDLDFLDTTGYVVLPVESSPLPIDASAPVGDERPFKKLTLTQNLNERHADEGKLILEVMASTNGLVPDLPAILDLAPEGFDVAAIEDQGVSVSKFDEEEEGIVSDRTWTVTFQAQADLPARPDSFAFGTPLVETVTSELYLYVDADLVPAEPIVALEQDYGEPSRAWLLWIPGGLLAALVAFMGLRYARRPKAIASARFTVPEPITPFTVLGLLRDIEQNNGLAAERRRELTSEIASLERHYFVEPAAVPPDLPSIAESWVGRAT
ncbi:MAG: hypothetical protein E2O39_06005 [Planctomycetota bacterium]|nr:MAG: hypothetical protein E2O39_06005 [Planctomycetota bacterium]